MSLSAAEWLTDVFLVVSDNNGRIRFQDLDTQFNVGFALFKGFVDNKKYEIPPDLSLKSTTKTIIF